MCRAVRTVCQTVVDHLRARKRKDLRLVLQPAERTAKEDTVVVALEAATDVGAFLRRCVSFVGEEVVPVHGMRFCCCKGRKKTRVQIVSSVQPDP